MTVTVNPKTTKPINAQLKLDTKGNTIGLGSGSKTIPLLPNQLVGSVRGGGGSILPGAPNSVSNGSSTKGYQFAFSAWGPYNAVQFVYGNHTGVPALIDNACAAASATAYPGGVFNIAEPTTPFGTPCGSVLGPAATGADPVIMKRQIGMGITPKMPVRSVPRAAGELDGGKYELVFGRIVTLQGNATATYGDMGANFPALYDPYNEGFSVLTGNVIYGTDIVTNPTSVKVSTREDLPGVALIGVVFSYDQKMTMIGGPGDSVYAGLGAAGGSFGIPPLFKSTARIRATGKMVSYFNNGISGSSMQQINIRGRSLVDLNILDIMVLHSHTINNAVYQGPSGTAADWDMQWYYLQDLIQYHLAKKSSNQVLLITPLPNNSFTTAQNLLRLKQRDRVMNSGFPFVDVESLCDAGGKWLNPAHAIDGTHATPAGQEAIARLEQPVLDTLVP